MRSNAEHMSPSGKLPFIKCGAFVVADLDPIVSFVGNKVSNSFQLYLEILNLKCVLHLKHFQGIALTDHLDAAQKADMRAYMSLANNIFGNAEVIFQFLQLVIAHFLKIYSSIFISSLSVGVMKQF